MPLPKLIALDLDGTLLTGDKRIGFRAQRAIAALRDRGSEVVLCTGRPPRSVRAYAEALELPLAIVYNGASLIDFGSGEATHLHHLEAALALEVVERMRSAFPDILAGMETAHGWYLELESYRRRLPALVAAGLPHPDGVGPLENFVHGGVIKLLFRHETAGVAAMAAAIAGLDVYRTWSGEALLEVLHPEVNKRAALERLAAERGIAREQVAAFGDEHNDCEMLAWAGCGIAMANGSAAARAAADRVTASNDGDGVAIELEAWLQGTDGG